MKARIDVEQLQTLIKLAEPTATGEEQIMAITAGKRAIAERAAKIQIRAARDAA